MDEPKRLRELACWYAAAAENASDPRIKSAMAAQALAVWKRADIMARPGNPRVAAPLPT
ncbi:MAG TPA: hypothetical protein VMQ11_02620 [Alphaproteobacteria bacterium]|nr:hypothetical protein [Alphaproteobacteria bacterium]